MPLGADSSLLQHFNGAVSILNEALHNSGNFFLRQWKSFSIDLNGNEQMVIF